MHGAGKTACPTSSPLQSQHYRKLLHLEEIEMKKTLLNLSAKLQTLMLREEGQDLIEYALVVSLIAFAAVTAMGTLATDINAAFVQIGTNLNTAVG
jgi:pilus assembly protein Flp/PilA